MRFSRWCCWGFNSARMWHMTMSQGDTVTQGEWFLMFQRFVVPSSSRSSNSWTITPQRWMHYDPSTCQKPLAQWLSITCITSQQPNVRSNNTVTVLHTFNNSLQVYKTLKEITCRYFVQFYMTDIISFWHILNYNFNTYWTTILTHTELQFWPILNYNFNTYWTTIPFHYPSKFSV